MKTVKYAGETDLSVLLDEYDQAKEELRVATDVEHARKNKLIAYAITHKLYDCLTINVSKLARHDK